MTATVTKQLTAYLIVDREACLELLITASYDANDPYAVRFTFPVPDSSGEALAWTFGRELLAAGMREPAGEGDVHVWPCGPDLVTLELCSGPEAAMIAVPTRPLRTFLFLSYAEVPPGYESGFLQIDRLLHDLMGRA